ncbi:hypothetical protein XENORESO_000920 [Xenotaenia resolanae]|uniref:Uncharacterized protein n=1 Tax=Xenotaenia resolanae TaxID=208358 RepID=A0ABV0VN39_9TELE
MICNTRKSSSKICLINVNTVAQGSSCLCLTQQIMADLSIAVPPWHPRFDVILPVCWKTQLLSGHVQHS